MNRIHRAALTTVLATYVLTQPFPVFAGDNRLLPAPSGAVTAAVDMIQQERAVQAVRDLLGGLNQLPAVHARYQDRDTMLTDHPTWRMMFTATPLPQQDSEMPSPAGSQEYVYAILDAQTGELIQFYHIDPNKGSSEAPSDELAQQKAEEFLKRAMPAYESRLGLYKTTHDENNLIDASGKTVVRKVATLHYNELVGNIPFRSNQLYVNVDADGHVIGFMRLFRFDSAKLPPAILALPKQQAEQEFAKQLDFHLGYQALNPDWNEEQQVFLNGKPYLAYDMFGYAPVDAISGQSQADLLFRSNLSQRKSPQPLTVKGTAAITPVKGKAEARQLIQQLFKVDLSQMTGEERKHTDFGRDAWSFEWREGTMTPEELLQSSMPKAKQIVATFDAQTGQLLRAHFNHPQRAVQGTKLTLEQGREQAVAYLQQHLPAGEQPMMLIQERSTDAASSYPSWFDLSKFPNFSDSAAGLYRYEFALTHQGVPVNDLHYGVEIDSGTGELISISLPQAKAPELPDSSQALSADQIKAKFLQDHPLQLVYRWEEFAGQKAPNGQLLYEPAERTPDFRYIDAFTGQEVPFQTAR